MESGAWAGGKVAGRGPCPLSLPEMCLAYSLVLVTSTPSAALPSLTICQTTKTFYDLE